MSEQSPGEHAGEHRAEVGSLAEEAAKLFGAVSGWAREQVEDVGDELSGLRAQAAAAAHDVDDHLATGSSECAVCPVCRAVRAIRGLDPDVGTHLAAAATSFAQAVAAFLETPVPPAGDDARDNDRPDARPEEA